MCLIFGSSGKNEEFQPQNEFKLEPWITLDIAGIDLSINKAVLYLRPRQRPDDRHDGLDLAPDEQKPNRVQTAIEVAYDMTKNTITGGNLDGEDGASAGSRSWPRSSSSSGSRT